MPYYFLSDEKKWNDDKDLPVDKTLTPLRADAEAQREIQKRKEMQAGKGSKADIGKQRWFSMPLVVLHPLADAFKAGELKYDVFNCLNQFDNPNDRFWDGAMRHMEKCQLDPLAIDQEIYEKYGIKVYHAAQVAFNTLMRLYHCLKEQEAQEAKNGRE